jgi:hypothetical protein
MQWIDSSSIDKGALYDSKSGKYLDTNITVPGSVETFPGNINNAGDIVFDWHDSSGNRHGALFVRSMKKFYKFNDPNGRDYTIRTRPYKRVGYLMTGM